MDFASLTLYSQQRQAHSRSSINKSNEWMIGKSCLQRGELIKLKLRGRTTFRWVVFFVSASLPVGQHPLPWMTPHCMFPLWLWHKSPSLWWTLCVVQQPLSASISWHLPSTAVTQKGVGNACVPCHSHANCQGQVEYFHPVFLPLSFFF